MEQDVDTLRPPHSTLFQGILDSRMASPHQPVEPAKVRPAPKRRGRGEVTSTQGEERAGERQHQADDELHLAHQRQALASPLIQAAARRLPCRHAAIEDGEVFATGGLEFLKACSARLPLRQISTQRSAPLGGWPSPPRIELVERHQARTGDVHLVVLDGSANVDQRHALAGLKVLLKLCGLDFHGGVGVGSGECVI
jgi:hypothetical protein